MASVGFLFCGLFLLFTCGADAAKTEHSTSYQIPQTTSETPWRRFRTTDDPGMKQADPTDISQPKIDIQTTQQVLNVQFGKLAAYRLNTLPDSVAAGARLAISAILAVAEQTAQN
ncbi:hypothetical protein RRG08_058038 [Elysia crispata]|uniref:Uncharacterized protein n=1 Tax=Elysia crispata TaxID=231223 RepID=A0AAE1A830_9GAST|nr:hypothetical protein RRG08_058038 [Elysia crispata]